MGFVTLHNEWLVEKGFFTFCLRHIVRIPVFCRIAFVPDKSRTCTQSVAWFYHERCIPPSYTRVKAGMIVFLMQNDKPQSRPLRACCWRRMLCAGHARLLKGDDMT
jgi:hypothetical protein